MRAYASDPDSAPKKLRAYAGVMKRKWTTPGGTMNKDKMMALIRKKSCFAVKQ